MRMKTIFFNGKIERILKERKNHTEKNTNSHPQHLCVAEDILLLKGGVLYGFTGSFYRYSKLAFNSKLGILTVDTYIVIVLRVYLL